jgi:hypothetical protein
MYRAFEQVTKISICNLSYILDRGRESKAVVQQIFLLEQNNSNFRGVEQYSTQIGPEACPLYLHTTTKQEQNLERWIVLTTLSANIFVTLTTQ